MWMRVPGWQIALAIVLLILMVLALAVLGGTARATDCLSLPWYRLLGCSIGTYESLSGGLIAAGGALFAGWLAWSAVREQLAIVQEQLSMERRKLKAAEITAQSLRVDQVSRVVSDLDTISKHGQILLRRIREHLAEPHPHATRFLELWKGQIFPVSPGNWRSALTGDEVWDLVCRMRSIAQHLEETVEREKGLAYNSIMSSADIHAAQSVAEFNAALEAVGRTLETQRAWPTRTGFSRRCGNLRRHNPHRNASITRLIAGWVRFLTFTQCGDLPPR
jgi:hypothetical protein